PAAADETYRGVTRVERTADRHGLPALGVTHVSDRHIVVLAPEKRHGVEHLAASQHIARSNLALTLGYDPMLHANALARVRIRPSGHIASGEDPRLAGFEEFIHGDAAIDREARALSDCSRRPDANTHHQKIGIERAAATQRHDPPGD